jgi:Protein of unknown function (DUF2796)
MVRFRRSRVACAVALLSTIFAAASLNADAAASAPAAAAPAHASQHAHVHGVARLGIAVQDKVVTIQFESPLDSLIGFEHRPASPAQKAAASALQAKMHAPEDLFRFDAAAGCVLTRNEAESAIFEPPVAGAADEHADLDASFEFRCDRPDKLSTLEVGLFLAYPRLKRITVDVATDKGQFERDLTSPQRTISLIR